MPVRHHLNWGAGLNPHGFGWAIQSNGGVHREVGLDGPVAIEAFMAMRADYPDGWAMFHSRHSKDGPGLLDNCQPLDLPDGSVLAHNGGLFPVDGDVSDTRIFIDEGLPHWDLTLKRDRELLEDRLGYNKIAIMRSHGSPIILNKALGLTLPDGTWHSNADFTGAFHLAPGQCGACHAPMRGAPEASRCEACTAAAQERRGLLRCRLMPGDPIPAERTMGIPGYVLGECGHRVAGQEWRAGFRNCERCGI